jgi:hypothetical protein
MSALSILFAGLLCWNAQAQETELAPEMEPPPPVVKLERIPPRTSYEMGVQMGFTSLPQFETDVSSWPGFGARFQWGKNIALHRIGVGSSFSIEGPAPKYFAIVIEPNFAWDFVSESGLSLGASIGPSLLLNSRLTYESSEWWPTIAPTAAVRIGWSQSWSRMGRRVHVFAEPKIRIIGGQAAPAAAIVIGSGRGK